MLDISSILTERKSMKVPRSERDELVALFTKKLCEERAGKNYYYTTYNKKVTLTPITLRLVALRLRFTKNNDDLRALYSNCKHSKSFSKAFWYLTQTKVLS